MAGGLQRSAQTFRRSGSSGLVWDERFLTDVAEDSGGARGPPGPCRQPELRHSRSVGMLPRRGAAAATEHGDKKRTKLVAAAVAKPKHNKDQQKQRDPPQEEEEEVAPGRKQAFRTRDVAPATEPPSPRLPAGCCAPCAIFRGGSGGASLLARRAKPSCRGDHHASIVSFSSTKARTTKL
ncbi:unnamed protein product [Urochloa decumbens]|uniref:MAPK kinase substrate protein n=1 Tax=Urochloa decumbens TaxID=240449 RepID=A0ABC9ELG5_9POAL